MPPCQCGLSCSASTRSTSSRCRSCSCPVSRLSSWACCRAWKRALRSTTGWWALCPVWVWDLPLPLQKCQHPCDGAGRYREGRVNSHYSPHDRVPRTHHGTLPEGKSKTREMILILTLRVLCRAYSYEGHPLEPGPPGSCPQLKGRCTQVHMPSSSGGGCIP